MSVINDMLRDLNQRRAPEVADGRASVPQSLIEPQKNTLKTLLVVLVFVLCVAVVTAYWFTSLKDSLSGGNQQSAESIDRQSVVQVSPVLLPADPQQQDTLSVSGEVSSPVSQVSEAEVSPSNKPQVQSPAAPKSSDTPGAMVEPAISQETGFAVRPQPLNSQIEVQSDTVAGQAGLAETRTLPVHDSSRVGEMEAPLSASDKDLAPEIKGKAERSAIFGKQETQQRIQQAPAAMQVSLSPAARDRQMAEQSQKLLDSGQVEQAYRGLLEFLEMYEVDDESRAVLANYLLQENRLAEAGDLLLNAPIQSSASLRQLKARWYAAQGDDKMALYTLNSELPEIKQYPDYYVLLAAYYQRFGWHREALKTYTALVEYDDSVADWWAGLALAADRTQDFKQAALAYELALELPGLNPELSRFVKNRLKQLRAVQRNSWTIDVNIQETHA